MSTHFNNTVDSSDGMVLGDPSTNKCTTFFIGSELYGIDIMCVEKVLPIQLTIKVPRSPKFFYGISNIGGEIVPIIDLNYLFNNEPLIQDTDSRTIIINSRGLNIGLMVSRMAGIESIQETAINPVPDQFISRDRLYVFGSYQLPNDQILILLDHEWLINDKDFAQPLQIQAGFEGFDDHKIPVTKEPTKSPMLHFCLGREHYSIETGFVEEILYLPENIAKPKLEEFIEGVFYYRNSAVPLINLRERLNLDMDEQPAEKQVVILKPHVFGIRIGLIVDVIQDIVFISENQLSLPPVNLVNIQREQIKHVFNLEEADQRYIVMLLDINVLITAKEKSQLHAFDRETISGIIPRETPLPAMRVLEFTIEGEIYALKTTEITEVIPVPAMIGVPKAPPYIRGVASVRGEVISIIDLPLMVREEKCRLDRHSRIIIVTDNKEKIGILVESVRNIRQAMLADFESTPDMIRQKGNVFIEAIGRKSDSDKLVFLIDTIKTLAQGQIPLSELKKDQAEVFEMVRKELELLEAEDLETLSAAGENGPFTGSGRMKE